MASPIEEFVRNVEEMCANGNYELLCDLLKRSSETLVRNIANLDSVLTVLNIENHSMGVLPVLFAKLLHIKGVDFLRHTTLLAQIEEFAWQANKTQIMFIPDTFADLYHTYTNNLIKSDACEKGIYTLAGAITTLQEHANQLTTLHAELCRLCLHSKNLKPAIKLLKNDISSISKEGGVNFDAKYFLLYYYYGGMVYTGVKDFERAQYFFEIVVTTPAMAVSHIMVEAYKKYILTSLILDGKGMPFSHPHLLPKQVPQIVGRVIKPLCQPYLDIANAYQSGNCVKMNEALNKNREALIRDKNYGLTKQVLTIMYKRNIKLLTKTFVTLSLDDVAQRANLNDVYQAESYLVSMIASNEICASIDEDNRMVAFFDPVSNFNNSSFYKKIENQIHSCIQISKQVKVMDEGMSISLQYIKKILTSTDEELTHQQKLSSSYMGPPPVIKQKELEWIKVNKKDVDDPDLDFI